MVTILCILMTMINCIFGMDLIFKSLKHVAYFKIKSVVWQKLDFGFILNDNTILLLICK